MRTYLLCCGAGLMAVSFIPPHLSDDWFMAMLGAIYFVIGLAI